VLCFIQERLRQETLERERQSAQNALDEEMREIKRQEVCYLIFYEVQLHHYDLYLLLLLLLLLLLIVVVGHHGVQVCFSRLLFRNFY